MWRRFFLFSFFFRFRFLFCSVLFFSSLFVDSITKTNIISKFLFWFLSHQRWDSMRHLYQFFTTRESLTFLLRLLVVTGGEVLNVVYPFRESNRSTHPHTHTHILPFLFLTPVPSKLFEFALLLSLPCLILILASPQRNLLFSTSFQSLLPHHPRPPSFGLESFWDSLICFAIIHLDIS